MKLYKSKKIVKATPMTLQEYAYFKEQYKEQPDLYNRIAAVPKNHELNTQGFFVGYPGKDGKLFDSKKMPHGCGYCSWAPADVFEPAHEEIIEDKDDKNDIIETLLKRNFTYHRPKNEDEVKLYEQIRKDTREYLKKILWVLPKKTRETALFCTKIDEAVMWANASVARFNK
jgi:hypothetical protein